MASSRSKSAKDNIALRGLGILGLLGIGAAHIELWLGVYQQIPTIGPLFEFTFIFAWVLALVMLVFPTALVAVVAAGFALATLGGYILALLLPKGIFLFTEQEISYAGGVAIASEVIGAVVLLAWAAGRVLAPRAASASAPFGATAEEKRSAGKARRSKTPRRAAASTPFGATAEDNLASAQGANRQAGSGSSGSGKPPRDKPARDKPARDKPARDPRGRAASVEAAIEKAQASFPTGASPGQR